MKIVLLVSLYCSLFLSSARAEFLREVTSFTASDGVKLSVTLLYPSQAGNEKMPVVLEMLPYRKDDLFFQRNYSHYNFFENQGIIFAQVDVRGTGSSSGRVPLREYSEQELTDAEELIHWLAHLPQSNGNVGMWGISWGGFNAIQVAMRQPKELKAIIACDATDDLFRDDIHYVDGIFHMDEYMLDMDHEVALPAPPQYQIDKTFLKDRLESYPWILTYMHQQRDTSFWSKNSLRKQYAKIKIPVFMIGGLLDTYRDSIPRMMSALKSPRKALIGPWVHQWPDNASPGPAYEWRNDAIVWWNHWLKNKKEPLKNEFTLFIREPFPPNKEAKNTPGYWCDYSSVNREQKISLFASVGQALQGKATQGDSQTLHNSPGAGSALGFYWGELTPNLKDSYEGELFFDSQTLKEDIVFAGIPKVTIEATTNQEEASWVARLEDVHPNGDVSFISGAALNGSQREIRAKPKRFVPGKKETFSIDLHFSTWKFLRGHKIRLTLANASFPMLWPSKTNNANTVHLGKTKIELPIISLPEAEACRRKAKPVTVPRPKHPDSEYSEIEENSWPVNITNRVDGAWKVVEAKGESNYRLKEWAVTMDESAAQRVNLAYPAAADYSGTIHHRYDSKNRWFDLRTNLSIRSDKTNFYVEVKRTLTTGDQNKIEKTWNETIPRDFQ